MSEDEIGIEKSALQETRSVNRRKVMILLSWILSYTTS